MPRGVPNLKTVEEKPSNPYEPLFLQALRDLLPSLRLYSDLQLIKKIGPEKVTDLSLEFFSYLESGVGGTHLTKNEQLALSNQALRCLSKYITGKLNMPVTLKTILDCISLLDYAVNQCFPGYAESGLLKYAVLPLGNQPTLV